MQSLRIKNIQIRLNRVPDPPLTPPAVSSVGKGQTSSGGPERFDRSGVKGMASNPNIEIRNSKQIQNPNAPMFKTARKV